jgi:thiol-disulfide isomerase/thioredoxin
MREIEPAPPTEAMRETKPAPPMEESRDAKPPSPHRMWLVVLIAFFVFWIGYLTFFLPRPPGPRAALSQMSQPAEYQWRLRDLNDQPVPFSRFKGKAVFLNIWATWCGPCVREMPSIARLASDPRLNGAKIEFVCVSIDSDSEVVRTFLKDKGWTMTFLRANGVPSVFRTEGIPATFVIAPDGRIAGFQVGAANWDEPQIVELLLKLGSA